MPASRHKDGRAHELAVTASIMCASGILDPAMFDHAALIGRLDDDGDWHSVGRIQRVEHLPELVRHLATQDVRTIIIPAANTDVEPIDGVRFIRVSTLADLTSIDEGTLPACDHIDRLLCLLAGMMLAVTRVAGHANPCAPMAVWMRSRAPLKKVSGMPMIEKYGRPGEMKVTICVVYGSPSLSMAAHNRVALCLVAMMGSFCRGVSLTTTTIAQSDYSCKRWHAQ